MMSKDGIGKQEYEGHDERYHEAKRNRVGSDDGFPLARDLDRAVKKRRPMYALRVVQQPERARLCSFKEENETIDRRPVDPPPVVEMLLSEGSSNAEAESSLARYFIRASIVHPQPVSAQEPLEYALVKTPTGADASAGEVVQTPEHLRGLDGKAGKMVIFAKLSVRMPGVFRLKFTLYQTTESGLSEITHTISDTFEVFSPKLFKGMRESTALTRHLAAQGLKVKLRTDTSVGRQSEARRRSSVQSGPTSPQPHHRAYSDPNRHPFPHHLPTHPPISSPNVPTASSSAPPRALVWREADPFARRSSMPMPNPGMPPYPHSPVPPPHHMHHPPPIPLSAVPGPPGPSHLGPMHMESTPPPPPHSHLPTHTRPRFMDDGLPPPLRDMGSPLNWTPSQSSDLAAFSLSQPSTQASSSVSTSRPSSQPFSPFSTHPSSVRSRTSSERSDSVPTITDLRIRGQDDGFSVLPIFPTQPSVTNLLSNSGPLTPQEPGTPSDVTLPPMRVAELRSRPGLGSTPDRDDDRDRRRTSR